MSEDTESQPSSDGAPAKPARELTEVEKMWLLPEVDQEAIYNLCEPVPALGDEPAKPGQTLSDARANILLHYQIELGWDSQLSRWRTRFRNQQERKAQTAFAEFLAENPGGSWTPDAIREWQLKCANTIADEKRNPALMLALAREIRMGETLALAKDKWREAAQKKLEAGLAALHEEIKNNPAALAIFEQLQAAVVGES